jgi:SpoVK/Ycf46/Vps4 family AAA+-type ATPase
MLDGALVRPGRLDRKFEIKNATNEQAGRLYQRFFGSLQGFKPVLDYMYSMAELQEMYLEKLDLKNLPTDKEKDEKEAVRRSRIRRFKLEEEGSY